MNLQHARGYIASSQHFGPHARHHLHLWLLLMPFLAGAFLLIGLPALITFGLAFTRYDAISPPIWNGLENFATIFRRELFWIAVRNSLLFAATAAPLQVLGALLLALLLHPSRRGVHLYRSSVYLTTVIPDVAYAMIWLWLFNPLTGPINLLLGWGGAPQPAWLVDPGTALPALVIMASVRVGEGMLLLIAARQAMPAAYFQAAMLDGADRWRIFRYLTLPLLAPWLLLLLIRDVVIGAHSAFTPVYIMTGGGPGYATTLLPFLIYEEAFGYLRIGQAAAMMSIMFVMIGLLVWLVYRRAGGWGYDDDQ
ncbi:MAG: sugar ABC transporter permease [Caldilinea sp.]